MPKIELPPKIIADYRESRLVIEELKRKGARIVVKPIYPGDYILSENFAIERKTVSDFLQSIYDKRIFDQVARMREAYENSCVIVEGNIAHELSLLPNQLIFWGAVARIVADGVSVIFTVNEEQTASLLFCLAKKLQEEGERVQARYKPKLSTLADKQLFAVQGLPGIGYKLADRLLRRFRTVRRVFKASTVELRYVVGRKKSEEITEFLDAEYMPVTYKQEKN